LDHHHTPLKLLRYFQTTWEADFRYATFFFDPTRETKSKEKWKTTSKNGEKRKTTSKKTTSSFLVKN
jgi:hypothetical protein